MAEPVWYGPPDWYRYTCAHCGTGISSRDEVLGRSYCHPVCGDYLDADAGECPCVTMRGG